MAGAGVEAALSAGQSRLYKPGHNSSVAASKGDQPVKEGATFETGQVLARLRDEKEHTEHNRYVQIGAKGSER